MTRTEYGPRALGNRSILYHPGDPSVNQWLNECLDRTEFMPFAPSTLVEDANKCYLGVSGAEDAARFMTITFDCTESMKRNCPGVVHIDGTARPQLVSEADTQLLPYYS
jgi:carbamoyltransferase